LDSPDLVSSDKVETATFEHLYYILTKFEVFLFLLGDHMLVGCKPGNIVIHFHVQLWF